MDDRRRVRRGRRRAPHALQLIALVLGCGTPRPDGTILWVAERRGHAEVWASDADGAHARPLAELPGTSFPAAPDPLGTHALVVTAEDGPRGHREGMWLIPLDGSPAAPFGPRSQRIRNPAWTADGQRIVFESDIESYRDLYAIPRAGGKPVRLTDAPHGSFEPAISPGGQLAFGTSRDGNAEIYAAAADGSNPVRLTDDVADDVHPAWRPDGGRLGWISHRGGAARIWTMAPDGTDARPLVVRSPGEQTTDIDFAWSPDGAVVAVAVMTGPREVDIDLVDGASGARLARLGGPGVDEHPAWSPDGRWLVYTSAGDLVRVTRAGDDPRPLTHDAAPDWLPRWLGYSTAR